MVDFIKRVENDRGLIKNIELAVPGFRGYRKKEDIRASDSLLRAQLADELREDVADLLEDSRKFISESHNLSLLKEIGQLIQLEKTVEARIRHAEQGYSGISPNYRIEEDALYALYEYDWNLIQHIKELTSLTTRLNQNVEKGDINEAKSSCTDVNNKFEEIIEILEERTEKIANLGVF